jgi:ABC-type sugar transport system substrate-binding protein
MATDVMRRLLFSERRGRSFTVSILLVVGIGLALPVSPASGQSAESVEADALRVAVFTPTTAGNTYWPEVHRVLDAAAHSLELEISFYEYNVSDRFAKAEAGVAQLSAAPTPDAAIFSVAFGQAQPLMTAAEALGIPFSSTDRCFPRK